jgi:hypothetical protein
MERLTKESIYSETRRNETSIKLFEAPRASRPLGRLGFIWKGEGREL